MSDSASNAAIPQKRGRPASQMPRGRRFGEGQPTNAGGRPKAVVAVQELARTHTVECVERLAFWMRSNDPRASVVACVTLLERGWGKPIQQISGDPNGAPLNISFSWGPVKE
jgi:hypothetical protein